MKRVAVVLLAFSAVLWAVDPTRPELWTPEARAQEPALPPGIEVKGDVSTIKVRRLIEVFENRILVKAAPFDLEAPKGGLLYRWRFPEAVHGTEQGSVLKVHEAPKGEVTVSVQWAVIDFKAQTAVEKFATLSFFVGEPGPVPDPPKPDPPKPDPPIPVGALRVIFVRESADGLTKDQDHAWNSTKIAAYLNAKAVKDGDVPGWRKWDDDVDVQYEAKAMQQLWNDSKAAATAKMPSIVIAVGAQAKVHDFPETEDKTLELLKKYGGP